jgi:hypothetical protein
MTPKELQECCRALDIDWSVTLVQLKAARNLQAQVWHPDRFQHDERLRLEAEEKLKRVNVAFERLSKLLEEGRTSVCDLCRAPVKDLKDGLCGECVSKTPRESQATTPRPKRPPRDRTQSLRHVNIGGRWQSQAGWVEFTGNGPKYRYTEWSILGQVGDGTATVSGNTVTLRGRNVLMGTYVLSLVVNGPILTGAMNIMGIPIPYQLWRA